MKQKMLLLGALVFAFLAYVVAYRQIDDLKKQIEGDAETVFVVSLNKTKVTGEELQESDMQRKELRRSKSQAISSREILWSQMPHILGRRLEHTVNAGDILMHSDLKLPTPESGFSRNVTRGMRAIGVPVDSVASANNLIKPGDNVDLIGTFRFPDMAGDRALDTVTLTILQNVKVLATGNTWDTFTQQQGDGFGRSYGSVVLLLSPDEVELIIFASQKGKISLSLRNYDDSRILQDIGRQSVNFRQLEQSIPKFNERRDRRINPRAQQPGQ